AYGSPPARGRRQRVTRRRDTPLTFSFDESTCCNGPYTSISVAEETMRRRDVITMIVAGAVAGLPHIARAQAYPTQPIKLIVPFGAGGSLDVLARLLGDEFTRSLGQTIVIDNRPGAAGNLAAEVVVKAEPDGHTLLVVSAAFAVNATLYNNLRFDPRKDFAPIAMLGATQNVLVANTQFPAGTLGELIARAKQEPDRTNYASTRRRHLGPSHGRTPQDQGRHR